jgi:TPR repeat protein
MREQINEKTRFLEAAGALIARGHAKFSIAALCEEARLDRDTFRAHFSGRSELMAALDEAAARTLAPQASASDVAAADTELSHPASVLADAWLERRLRVFERALTVLESRTDTAVREHACAIARLEEKVGVLTGSGFEEAVCKTVGIEAAFPVANGSSAVLQSAGPDVEISAVAAGCSAMAPSSDVLPDDSHTPSPEARERQKALLLPLEVPSLEKTVPRAEMAQLLAAARGAVRAVVEQQQRPERSHTGLRLRWLALGCLSLVALFIGIGLTLGDPAGAAQAASGSGVIHRHVSRDSFARMVARADSGDVRAQSGLALAYLRGESIQTNPRAALHWAEQAGKAGDPLGQYLAGTLYHQGEGVAVDYRLAFRWFAAAAQRGNIRAMHNLAIAYAEGQGTRRDAAKAAQWFARAADHGYVDSAFDLAVLFERGDGLPQDPVQALKWYQIAAALGDVPSRERAETLRHQMNHREVAQADAQARQFQKLMPLASANSLAAF